MPKRFKVIGLGELLWDMLPSGSVLGGAPANFAYHAGRLGAGAAVISAVGKDQMGKEAQNLLERYGVRALLSLSENPTGSVGVQLINGIPSYTIIEDVAWDDIRLTPQMYNEVAEADAICFGSLAQRCQTSREAICELIEHASSDCLVVYDANLRQNFYSKEIVLDSLFRANILKINSEELDTFSDLFGLTGSEEERCLSLLTSFGLTIVALTKGADGSCLFAGRDKSLLPSPQVLVADTVGAGDAFTAALVLGVLNGSKLADLHRKAVELSAWVCTCKGAMPDYPKG